MKVKKFYYPEDTSYSTQTAKEIINLAKKESGCKIYDAKSGIKIKSGGATLEFVHSTKNYSSDNEDSVMTYIDYGNLEVLLTGDAENGAKKYSVDILQVPHHASEKSSSQKITATKPGSGSISSNSSSSNNYNSTNTSTKYVYCNGGSSSSNKYHKSATAHGMKVSIKMSESNAKKKGYLACKTCF